MAGRNRFVFIGLDELVEHLRDLPRAMADEGGTIVLEAANDAAQHARLAYPVVSGGLREGVTVETQQRGTKTQVVVYNRSKYAMAFEYGTAVRQTKLGYNRGPMPEAPPHQRMLPILIRYRARMWKDLMALGARKGLVVTGQQEAA